MTKQNLLYPFGSLKCKTVQVFQQDMDLCLMSMFHCHVTMLVYLIYPRCAVCFAYPDVWVCGVLRVSLHSSCSLHHSAPRQMLGTWKVNTCIMLHVEDMEEVIFGTTLKSDIVPLPTTITPQIHNEQLIPTAYRNKITSFSFHFSITLKNPRCIVVTDVLGTL